MAKKIIKARMQQRQDTLAGWAGENPVLLKGELGLVSDDPNAYKVGDGVTAWNDLPMRGWDGNIAQTTGDSTTAVMSQKAVTEGLDGLDQRVTNVSIQANRLELMKVTVVPGKGLSTNDYSNAEKQKLAGLQNYDDTELRAQVAQKADRSELTELSDEVGKKADAVGTYLEFTAGRSIDMLGVHEGDDSEFLFRPTDGEGSIKDGEAVVERIEGNSVVWNQLLKNNDISNTINGLTVTNNGDGSWTANGTPSADVWLAIDQYPFASVVGHKYLLYGCPKGGNVGTYCLFEAQGRLSVEEGNGSITAVNSTELRPFIVVRGGVVCNNLIFRPRVVDLTKMFGAGFEPLTIEEFYQRIPSGIDLNAYNEGEMVDCKVQGIKSVGFNQWKAEPSFDSATYGENYIIVIENNNDVLESLKSVYMLLADGHDVYYSAKVDGTAIGVPIGSMALFSNGSAFDAVLDPNRVNEASRFKHLDKDAIKNAQFALLYATNSSAWSISDICFSLVHTGYRNGEYEPYKESEVALPILNYFPNGMRSIGSVCDEITQKQTIQRIGAVDLGDLAWFRETGKDGAVIMISNGLANLAAKPIYSDTRANLICAKYHTYSAYEVVQNAMGVSINPSGDILIYDSAYTDTASFAAAMRGVILYYELEEPIVTEIEPMLLSYEAWDFGTEQALADAPTAPIKASIVYGFNARDTIRNNRNSIEELTRRITILEQMLGVMAAQAQAVNFVE